MADTPDAYEQMSLARLRQIAEKRPVRNLYLRKAELIDELRTLDQRVANGEPEDHVAHASWKVDRSIEKFREHSLQEGLDEAERRIRDLLERPQHSASFQAGVRAAIAVMRWKEGPSDEDWGSYVDRLADLLSPLAWAGWEIPESYDSDFDFEHGPFLFGFLTRTNMVITVGYEVNGNRLTLGPDEAVSFDSDLDMLDDVLEIHPSPGGEGRAEVEAIAGAHGLLDPTRLKAAETSDVSTEKLLGQLYSEFVFASAQRSSGLPIETILDDASLKPYLGLACFTAGHGVVPDLVPSAVALGIATWCWRNNTAVEAHHLPSDVLMARVNIAATKAVQDLIDPYEGVDWEAVEQALTSETWQLADGRRISALFGDGWNEVKRTVRDQVRSWRRLDEEVLGPEATMRLFSVGGATSYSDRWWGQGRWTGICRRVILDAQTAGIPLPSPFDEQGAESFIDAAADPDNLTDAVLDWLIEVPPHGTAESDGLRFHQAARPIVREFELFEFTSWGDSEDDIEQT
ncbi:hypothetical protein [Glycomyces buryatensis]|uniref:hypothetical protein n=1 Tax=Glycomyces buryatensis TaxID=2570927 RepID=UPI001FE756E6|nr:hypothetical protein [Glycomyces buryatensis]